MLKAKENTPRISESASVLLFVSSKICLRLWQALVFRFLTHSVVKRFLKCQCNCLDFFKRLHFITKGNLIDLAMWMSMKKKISILSGKASCVVLHKFVLSLNWPPVIHRNSLQVGQKQLTWTTTHSVYSHCLSSLKINSRLDCASCSSVRSYQLPQMNIMDASSNINNHYLLIPVYLRDFSNNSISAIMHIWLPL